MGRKTNSVSLRLKKTNRDYNNCWYSDILYAESFSKSLKIENYLSQTLKNLGMPCPQTSVIGAFKKAALLICYLDPKKRKRLLEKLSKGKENKAPTLKASLNNPSSTKTFLSLGKVKQDSKALLKPLHDILQTNLEPLPFQYWSEQPLTIDYSSTNSTRSLFRANYASEKASQHLRQQPPLEPTLVSTVGGRKLIAIEKKLWVKKLQEKTNSLSHTISTKLNYFHRGSISLDLVKNKEFAIDLPHIESNGVTVCPTSWQQSKPLFSFSSICNFLCLATVPQITIKMPRKKVACIDARLEQLLAKQGRHAGDASTYFAARVNNFQGTRLIKDYLINNNNTSSLLSLPVVSSSTTCLKIGAYFSFLDDGFFFKKQQKNQSSAFNLLNLRGFDYFKNINYDGKLDVPFFKKNVFFKKWKSDNNLFLEKVERQNHEYKKHALQKNPCSSTFTGLQFFPFFFDNKKSNAKAFSRFKNFSDFFYSEVSNLALISIFSKNSQIFGKNKESHDSFSMTRFSCLSELLLNATLVTNNFNKKKNVEVLLLGHQQINNQTSNQMGMAQIGNLQGYDSALSKNRENCSLNSLYGFYNSISSFWGNLACLSFYKSTNQTSCALFLAECVGYLLEKKVLFRSIKRQLLLELHQSKYDFSAENPPALWASQLGHLASQASVLPLLLNKKKVTGIRITCSGRVGGRSKKAQRSRKDTFMWGETGLHVFSSKLDFAKTHAETPFGLVGVQVWVCSK